MKKILQLEEALMLVLAVYLNTLLPYPWWLYWALFLAPDIGMAGYAFGPRAGAVVYNFFHHKGVAIVLVIAGLALSIGWIQFTGLLLFGHSAFDRLLGYGLKYGDSFHHTHLGKIGKAATTKG